MNQAIIPFKIEIHNSLKINVSFFTFKSYGMIVYSTDKSLHCDVLFQYQRTDDLRFYAAQEGCTMVSGMSKIYLKFLAKFAIFITQSSVFINEFKPFRIGCLQCAFMDVPSGKTVPLINFTPTA